MLASTTRTVLDGWDVVIALLVVILCVFADYALRKTWHSVVVVVTLFIVALTASGLLFPK